MAYNSLCIYEIRSKLTIFVTKSSDIKQFGMRAPGSVDHSIVDFTSR